MARLPALALAASILHIAFTSAQSQLQEQVLATVIYVRYGDRTPFIWTSSPELTPLGSQQLYSAGSFYRSRYVSPAANGTTQDTSIRNISPYLLNYDDVQLLTTGDQYVVASAQAFVQGLYPPLGDTSNSSIISGISVLADGSNTVAPMDGYQYPNILAPSENDYNSIFVAGQQNCPVWTDFATNYYTTDAYQQLEQSTIRWYESLETDFLDDYFSNASVGYFDAYYIWDYLNYANIHNGTIANVLKPADLEEARLLADDWVFAQNANTSVSGNITTISGQALAARVLEGFYSTVNTQGQTSKMTLLFGSYEPMVAFAALAGLVTDQSAAFYHTPGSGSSYVFELFTLLANDTTSSTYPDESNLYVRFMYQNGTDDNSGLVEYPLFGYSPSSTIIPYTTFLASMSSIMLPSIGDWCSTCQSYSIFCPAFVGNNNDYHTPSTFGSSSSGGISPAVAGVVGAVVALLVMFLLIAAVMLLGGVRLHRNPSRRRSALGGFRGAEKLASDQDLTLPKGGVESTVVSTASDSRQPRERVGSWELKDQMREPRTGQIEHVLGTRPSFEQDEISIVQSPEPVKAYEHV